VAGRAPAPRRAVSAPDAVRRGTAARGPRAAARGPRAAARGPRFAVVAARFNEPITKRLVSGALHAFGAAGVPEAAVEVHWVPGSFELPQAASHLAATGRYAGIVCLGVVIRGQTPHFEHVAREAAAGIREVALATGVPAAFGVITALTEEQAWDRAGGEVGNRGEEAANAALEMADLVARVRADGSIRPNVGRRGPAASASRQVRPNVGRRSPAASASRQVRPNVGRRSPAQAPRRPESQ
jgi:6,7-dimethyl-8-ribityllumazine synthase